MPTRIWLGSWNLDSVNPSPADLNQWLTASTPPASACDVVVLGLQEAKNTSRTGVDVEALGTAASAYLPNHQWLTEHALEGHTKTSDNCQSLAILCNVRTAPVATFRHGGASTYSAFECHGTVPKTDGFLKKVRKFVGQGERGKGGIVGQVKYNGRKFAFTTAHLDSHVDADRVQQIWQLQNKVTQLQPDVAFFMGDLNYRLRMPTAAAQQRLDNLANRICTPLGRGLLLTDDTLPGTALINTWGYTFPPPREAANGVAGDLIFPTYKRKKLSPVPTGVGPMQTAQAQAVVKASYGFETEKRGGIEYVKESGRAGEIDAGWLDRVGYRSYGVGVNFNVGAFGADHGLNVSDHVPIYMVVDVA